MKYLIASDIHGSAVAARLLIEAFEREKADKLILLGDIYYHGPRNPLPNEYNPKAVAQMLNSMKDKLLVTRGNCDAEVDLMISSFEFLPLLRLEEDGLILFFSHGDRFEPNNPPALGCDIMFYGHFHVGVIKEQNGMVCANPASAAFSTPRSYLTYENRKTALKELEFGGILAEYTVK